MASSKERSPGDVKRAGHQKSDDPSARLQEVLRLNRESGRGGVYAVCSAHPQVIEAAIEQVLEDGSVLHVESTSSQVNQFGGYTGQTPLRFSDWIRAVAQRAGLPTNRVVGGDHRAHSWRSESWFSIGERFRVGACTC
jgi:tagatose-1,6-bisphosphate aldolase non-catalytic subunit AgaZ/GatZ